MLKTLTIQNFQSHKKSEINFHTGVNVIIGNSDSGKSAIIRALRWLVFNQPNGDEFCSWWGGETVVSLTFYKDITMLTKSKIKDKKSRYELNDMVFSAFGTEVPIEISEYLAMNEINLQSQLDSPFLISNTSGEVARHFNKIANLDKIDIANGNINKSISKIKQDIDHYQTDLTLQTKSLEQFAYLDAFEMDLKELEILEKKLNNKQKYKQSLNTLCSKIEEVQNQIDTNLVYLEIEKPVCDLIGQISKKTQLVNTYTNLTKLIKRIKENKQRIAYVKDIVSIEEELLPILDLIEQKKQKENDKIKIKKLIQTINSIKTSIEDVQILYNKLNKQFEINMPKICPLCGK